MSAIDSALMQYNNQPLKIPGGAKQVQGLGAHIAPSDKIDKKSKLYEQCLQFESLFVQMMLKEMNKTVEKTGLMDGGDAEEIFQDMLQEQYAQSMTKTADFGIADSLYRQLASKS
jgi:flagellar protein FlgJ